MGGRGLEDGRWVIWWWWVGGRERVGGWEVGDMVVVGGWERVGGWEVGDMVVVGGWEGEGWRMGGG